MKPETKVGTQQNNHFETESKKQVLRNQVFQVEFETYSSPGYEF